ncbi:tryptophan--tRNA ligase [Patescibacteria group bacterium]|nr:tryptophan--tRNA ligase [Patescibacteria group bacterium]
MKRFLSGITPSGDGSLHIGNYLGAVRQFISLSRDNEAFLMIADLHALTTIRDKKRLEHNVEELVRNELALLMGTLGGELPNITFFRQSDVPAHTELQSILNNVTPLGLVKRAHAYKDKLEKESAEEDINLGLFNYPVLMAADILLYQTDFVPVGKDQKQHIEITRDIAGRFNKTFCKKIFKLPEPYIPEEVSVIMGTDGKRKMSKSLGNIISIFEPEEVIRKQVMETYTDPARIHATDLGHIAGNMVFRYLEFFGTKQKVDELKEAYKKGQVADVEVKNYLYASLLKTFAPAREKYHALANNPEAVREILQEGARKANAVASRTMVEARRTIGLSNAYSCPSGSSYTPVPSERQNQGLTPVTPVTLAEFARMEIRVGKVIEASNKEGSEKLIRLVVDVGETKPRIIFTGVRGFGYTPEDFAGKQFLFITNLAPRKMMGEESQGMILAVDGNERPRGEHDAKKPVFITAEGMPLGAKVR